MVRVTPEQLASLREKATDSGVTVPEYLRACGLNRRIRSKMEAHIINELRRLGGLQKYLFTQGGGVLSKEFAAVLVEIRAAITRIGD
ncbi:mobilization protein [Xylella fastidiosa subsp. multiplex]|nr:plasmid mobilization protein MobA [Xylella fastidiosa]MRU28332.1 mobilization protein [Xylella fastidiosa subsp. multiplex]MRU30722.1 mobilization protein [Xylella fastidiosa subsp. multiplex]